MNHLIHCPKCQKKIDEREMREGEIIKKYCENCKIWFWVLAELEIKILIEANKISDKSLNKGSIN